MENSIKIKVPLLHKNYTGLIDDSVELTPKRGNCGVRDAGMVVPLCIRHGQWRDFPVNL
jgi:hypothetical protein